MSMQVRLACQSSKDITMVESEVFEETTIDGSREALMVIMVCAQNRCKGGSMSRVVDD